MPDTSLAAVADQIARWVVNNNPSSFNLDTLPREASLLELGVLDSYGVVELVDFLETNWGVSISDDEITKEKMGSIYKMAILVCGKLAV